MSLLLEAVIAGAALIIVGLVTWLVLGVNRLQIFSSTFAATITEKFENNGKAFQKLEQAVIALAEERKVLNGHSNDINNISIKVLTHSKSIKGVERFLGDKHGSEFYAVYEKYQDTNS